MTPKELNDRIGELLKEANLSSEWTVMTGISCIETDELYMNGHNAYSYSRATAVINLMGCSVDAHTIKGLEIVDAAQPEEPC